MDAQLGLENRTAYRFSVLATLNMRCVASFYTKKFGITTAGWRIMSIIGRYEPVFPSMAAQLCTMDPDKVTRSVDRLVDLDLVIRNTDNADRRRVILCLTSKGRAAYNEIEQVSQDLENELRSVLTKQEWEAFRSTMDKLDAQAQKLFSEEATAERFSAAHHQPRAAKKAKTAPAAKTPRKRTAAAKA